MLYRYFSSLAMSYPAKIGRAMSDAHPSPVHTWKSVKSDLVNVPKNSSFRSLKKETPRMAYMDVTRNMIRNALSTGRMDAVRDVMICRSDRSRPKSLITRNARMRRRCEKPGASENMEMYETVTTMKSKHDHPSAKNSQNQLAKRLTTSSTPKRCVNATSASLKNVYSTVPSTGLTSNWAALMMKFAQMKNAMMSCTVSES
mmetsp:Transcript_59188/g.140794  ORF Transcript_59188/g.140794 Transcript_59188/m.140794 type:complete len:201 (-) Transcript_59188:985-1587(-)